MMVIITYDVDMTTPLGAKRLRKVARLCVDHGQRVQNSVFECIITEADLTILKKNLSDVIDQESDSIRFYYLGINWQHKVEMIGKQTSYNMEDSLII